MDTDRRQCSDGEMHIPLGVRQYPYPFKAMLAICSDLDETPDWQAYWTVMRCLNSREIGPRENGVGLEVGNSIYFDMPPGQFSYWNTNDHGRAMIRALIGSGHVDCLHSFGDLAVDRGHAGRALDELSKHDCRLAVWVDHAVAPSNFGSDIMNGFGDVPGHRAYHADLTRDYGIRYVWRGRVTSVIGQDRPGSLRGIWNRSHRLASMRTLAKEAAKRTLSLSRKSRYRIHGRNRLAGPARLRDGTAVTEFLRCNPHWGGVSSGDTADGIADVITTSFLDLLVQRRGCCVLYTHLGKRRRRSGEAVLSAAAMDCFRLLAERQAQGDVLVTTTRRMLDYRHARDLARLSSTGPRQQQIDISWHSAESCPEPQGLTVYTNTADETEVRLNRRPLSGIIRNAADDTGRPSVSIPWRQLSFPQL